MPDPQTDEDLRATSESITEDTESLARIEERKRDLPEGDPERVSLSEEAEDIARDLVPKTVAERELATEAVEGS